MAVTGPSGTVANSPDVRLVGTEFTPWYWLHIRSGQVRVFNMHIQSKLL